MRPKPRICADDGHPMRLKAAPGGWTVYSIGRDGVDDGGRFDNAADIGVAPEPAAAQAR